MHELGVAQSIVDAVLSEAERVNAKRVKEINIDVGELMQLDVQVLTEALSLLTKGSKLEGARVLTHVKGASFSCRRCGAKWNMMDARKQLDRVADELLIREPDSKETPLHFLPYMYNTFIQCPKCGSSDASASPGADDLLLRKLVME
jgi:hydrogenase nickel incorporation protein HypA/HybF